MASISYLISSPNLPSPMKLSLTLQSKNFLQILQPTTNPLPNLPKKLILTSCPKKLRLFAVAEDQTSVLASPSEAARRLYIGNIPRTVNNDELTKIVEEHGAVEKAEVMYDKYSGRSRRFAFVTMKTVEDANAAIEKINGTKIGGREIKVNITEKPLPQVDLSLLQAEDSQFIDSPHKVYVGNLAKTVTSDTLKKFFSEKGKVVSAKVSRVPGTSKSRGFGFVTFSSEEEVEAAVSSFNNSLLEGQQVRVNKA
ncbi:30S ribosomal protein 2, chloroplastic [Durio zibethinus]|uniref:Small ribosomal subunit protein cS22 n=1 Tax=Durio zibethinus TaxID=66656 RepID=A0A6P6A388_DURZI|nr:30S ribosomal protein 2, chloroplastic [Durio zibethinus]